MTFTVTSASGMVCCLNSTGSENEPMKSRIRIGTSVHATSTGVWWLKRAGVGLARRLKRMKAYTISAVTNKTIPVMMIRIMLDRPCSSRATSVAAGWKSIAP